MASSCVFAIVWECAISKVRPQPMQQGGRQG